MSRFDVWSGERVDSWYYYYLLGDMIVDKRLGTGSLLRPYGDIVYTVERLAARVLSSASSGLRRCSVVWRRDPKSI